MTPTKTIERPKITLDSDKTAASVAASIELERAQAQMRWAEDAALAGEINGSDLATARDNLDLAQLRADRALADADAEREALGSDAEIHDAIAELLKDPELNTTTMLEAFDALSNALVKVQTVTKNRNDALNRWIMRLRDIGLPDRGLTIGKDDVTIVTGAGTEHRIKVGGATVSSVVNVSAHIAHVMASHIGSANRRTDPADLARLDRRGESATPNATVRLLRAIGGHPVNTELSTRTHSAMNLARMVRDGSAEIVSGDLPEPPEEKLRVIMGGDTTPRYANETDRAQAAFIQQTADRAVAAAFGKA